MDTNYKFTYEQTEDMSLREIREHYMNFYDKAQAKEMELVEEKKDIDKLSKELNDLNNEFQAITALLNEANKGYDININN